MHLKSVNDKIFKLFLVKNSKIFKNIYICQEIFSICK